MAPHDHEHLYENVLVTKLPKSEVEITVSVPPQKYTPYRAKALKNRLENLELPGFRKGHVPESTFISQFGEQAVLEEIADLVFRESYPHLISENKLSTLGLPQITITKLAKDNPIEFKIRVALYPEVMLPDYRAIAKEENAKIEEVHVTEKEVADTILNFRKSKIPKDKTLARSDAEKEENLPLYDDAFVQSFGNFTDVKDFETKLYENVKREKERMAKGKKRTTLLERLTSETEVEVPDVFIENELSKMLAQFESDITRMGGTLDTYLAHIKKTRDDLRRDWRGDAEKRAKLELVLREIWSKEKLESRKEDVEKEVAQLREHYKDADPAHLQAYVESMLKKEEVVKFLENQK